jgi:UDP-N-acetylmuramoyl-tripeptide--D-alanyl-D-alanine ligase
VPKSEAGGRNQHATLLHRDSLAGVARFRAASLLRRSLLARTTFVVVTGSCGKTTTKELIATVLASRMRGYRSPAHCNSAWHVVRNVLHTRPWHQFSVAELPGAGSSLMPLDELLPLIRPDISVVTSIGQDHYTVFRTLDAAAQHKGKVVDYLGADGVAILNADDPHVAAMSTRCAGRVITCGTSPQATMRASEVSSVWPEPLSCVVTAPSGSVRVQTQLCGAHWLPYVLSALAVGEVMGVPLQAGAAAVAAMAPFPGRMSPRVSAEGVTFICDDEKAPLWTADAAFNFMREAQAPRKVAVLGRFSDFPGTERTRILEVANRALDCVDVVVAVGPQAPHYLRAGQARRRTVYGFADAEQARSFLKGFACAGDLILLKGSGVDHLGRIAADWHHDASHCAPLADVAQSGVDQRPRIVVGLGNADPRYTSSPHNVGYRTLDVLADRLGLEWAEHGDVTTASAQVGGRDVRFVKFRTDMNDTGPRLRHLAQRIGSAAGDCVVILDDMDLAPGVARWRPRGSAGGHRGLSSVLVAFQSDAIPRVKIGVGKPATGSASTFVTSPMEPWRRILVEDAFVHAADLVLEVLEAPTGAGRTITVADRAGVLRDDPAGA